MRKQRLIALGLALASLSAAPAWAAGFDCARAVSAAEVLICASPALSALDSRLNVAFRNAVARARDSAVLRSSQRAWLADDERARCRDEPCLARAITARIVMLENVAPAAQAAGRWTGRYVFYLQGRPHKELGSIDIIGSTSGRLLVDGAAFWYGSNARSGQVNDGVMRGETDTIAADGGARFDVDGCKARLQLRGDTLVVSEESGCGGLNVSFNGSYRRQ